MRDFRQGGEYTVLELTGKGDKTNTVAVHIECQIALRRYLAVSGHGEERDAPLFLAVKAGRNMSGALTPNSFTGFLSAMPSSLGYRPRSRPTPHGRPSSPKPMRPG